MIGRQGSKKNVGCLLGGAQGPPFHNKMISIVASEIRLDRQFYTMGQSPEHGLFPSRTAVEIAMVKARIATSKCTFACCMPAVSRLD